MIGSIGKNFNFIGMKNIVLSLLAVSISFYSSGQNNKFDSVYIAQSFGLGTHVGFDLSISKSINKKFRLGLGYSYFIRKASSTPNDYETGLVSKVLSLGLLKPYDILNSYHVIFGRVFPFTETVALNFEGALGLTRVKQPEDWVFQDNIIGLADNYTYTEKSYNLISFRLKPTFEIQPLDRFYFTVAPQVLYSSEQVVFSGNIGLQYRLH